MANSRELVFVDSGLSDIPVLLRGLRPDVEAIVLDASQPAPAQIAAELERRPRSAAVHVLAHGRPGEISFAAGALSQTTLPDHARDLARIGRALDGGGLNLWSCRTAQGDAGRDFTEALADAAGGPVAAATQLVGAAALGGRWTLGSRVGDADVTVPLTAAGIEAYGAVLDTKTWVGVGPGPSSWGDSNNWDPVGVPQDGDDVTVDVAGSLASIEADTAILASLLMRTPVIIGGFKLEVSGAGITLDGAGALLGGFGTIAADITGTGMVGASMGVLTLSGIVDGPTLAIDTPSPSTLKITGTATTPSAISINNANQTLEVAVGGSLTIGAAESITNGTIKLTGGTLTDDAGLMIGSGATLAGFGTVAADIAAGAGTITAAGGPLVLSGTVASGNTFTIDDASLSTLKFTGIATVASAIVIDSANQTLEVGAGGNLTINAAQSITDGKIVLSGGTLTDALGLTIGSGATLTGFGTVTTDVTADGGSISVDALDGEGGSTLEIDGSLLNTGVVTVGNDTLSGSATLTADAIDNDCGCGSVSIVGGGAEQATMTIASTAGFGTDGTLVGDVELSGNALLEFATGTITTIEIAGSLWLDGALARINAANNVEDNSVLAGLTLNEGGFRLSNGAAVTTDSDLVNDGGIFIDSFGDNGGSKLEIGGKLTNVGILAVGNETITDAVTLTADSIDNDCGCGVMSIIGGDVDQATVTFASVAGFGTDGVLIGGVVMSGNALLEFAGGGTINTIDLNSSLWLDGPQARMAVAGALDSNSALTGLTDNEGTLDLTDGAEVTLTGTLNNSGFLQVDGSPTDPGGSTLTIGGGLVNNGMVALGNSFMSSSTAMSANTLFNLSAGTIEIAGNSANEARLDVQTSAFNDGIIDVYAGGVLDVGGEFHMYDWSELTVERGGILAMGGASTVHTGGLLDISGDLEMNGASKLTVQGGGTLTTGAFTTVLKVGAGTTSIIDMRGESFESQYRIVVESGTLQFIGTAHTPMPELTGAGLIQGEVSLDGSTNILTITPTGQVVGTSRLYHFYHTDLSLAYANVIAANGDQTITGSDLGEVLTAGKGNDKIYAGTGADKLYGLAGVDQLYGSAGDDRLDGGTGADVMTGGTGNDTYFIDNAGDQVIEAVGEGIDRAYAKVNYTLGAGQEVEFLRAYAGTTGLTLTGNELRNTIEGAAGDDRLYGGGGGDKLVGNDGNDYLDGGVRADNMAGGVGNDTYFVDNAGDQVIEAVGEGIDRVYAKVDYTLAAGQEIEFLRANAGTTGLTLTGNELRNTIEGAAGNDTLNGGGGGDKLIGGDGADTLDGGARSDILEGGAGADIFMFTTRFMGTTNVDTIADFDITQDVIHLDHTYFAGLALGQLSASAFAIDSPTGTDPQIVYDSTTGSLSYDSNGADPGGSGSFAKVTGVPVLTASKFFVV